MQDPSTPQWMRSRLEAVEKRPACGGTHGICRCYMERIISLEAEISELRMSNYDHAIEALEKGHEHTMKVFGNSMLPLIQSGSKLTFKATGDYEIGDIVFCRVKGRFIQAHQITKVDEKGRCMIANRRGRENGWASTIFGRVIAANGEAFGRPV